VFSVELRRKSGYFSWLTIELVKEKSEKKMRVPSGIMISS